MTRRPTTGRPPRQSAAHREDCRRASVLSSADENLLTQARKICDEKNRTIHSRCRRRRHARCLWTHQASGSTQRRRERRGPSKVGPVAVLPGGCSGFQYGLNIEDEPEADDEILELSGVRIFLDPFSVQYLEGVEIDYVTSMMGSGFTFRNPNASGGCGCGSSFTA